MTVVRLQVRHLRLQLVHLALQLGVLLLQLLVLRGDALQRGDGGFQLGDPRVAGRVVGRRRERCAGHRESAQADAGEQARRAAAV